MISNAHHIRSKMLKTHVLLKHSVIRDYVPETRRFSPYNLQQLLEEYNMVYVKPDNGRHGRGVMKTEKVTDNENKGFKLYFGRQSRYFSSYGELVAAINRLAAARAYIVQQGIRMLDYDNLPFDIRIIVQQVQWRKWKTTVSLPIRHEVGSVINY